MANYKSDEEYHFSEGETPVSYTTEPKQSVKDKDFQGRKKGRNIILLLAIIMAFWAIYKFMGIFFSQIKQAQHKPAVPVHQPIMATPPKPQPIQPSISQKQLQEISEQKDRLNKLESETINLQTTLADINTKLSDLSTQINNLTSQVNKPPVVEIKKPIRIKKRPPRRYKPYISYSYQLEAAIPGRAWIMRSDGTNLTVSLGDKIPGYGSVVGIDPNDGVVQMSSGANIKYRAR